MPAMPPIPGKNPDHQPDEDAHEHVEEVPARQQVDERGADDANKEPL